MIGSLTVQYVKIALCGALTEGEECHNDEYQDFAQLLYFNPQVASSI